VSQKTARAEARLHNPFDPKFDAGLKDRRRTAIRAAAGSVRPSQVERTRCRAPVSAKKEIHQPDHALARHGRGRNDGYRRGTGTGARPLHETSTAALIGFLERLQSLGLEDDGPAIFQLQYAAALPFAQATVDVLPGRPRHFGQFPLRQR
jgi:hypothetical protein